MKKLLSIFALFMLVTAISKSNEWNKPEIISDTMTYRHVSGRVVIPDSSELRYWQVGISNILFIAYEKETLLPAPDTATKIGIIGGGPFNDDMHPGAYDLFLSDKYYYRVKIVARAPRKNEPANDYSYRNQFYANTGDVAEAEFINLDKDTSGINFNLDTLGSEGNFLSGFIKDDLDSAVDAYVTAYRIDSEKDGFTSPVAYADQGGVSISYMFPYLNSGEYILHVAPFFGKHESGYYSREKGIVASWQEATPVTMTDLQSHEQHIIVKRLTTQTAGNGTVSGMISGRKGMETMSLKGAHISILGENDALRYSTTADRSGRFEIKNIDIGSYKIVIDKPGYETDVRTFTVEQSGGGLILDAVMTGVVGTTVQTSTQDEIFKGEIIPNPSATDQVVLKFAGNGGNAEVKVVDMLGREVFKNTFITLPQMNYYLLNVHEFPAGNYIVTVAENSHIKHMPKLTIIR